MNKILLSLGVAILALTSSIAQTNSIDAGNFPNSTETGYTFNFQGNAVQNCISQTKNEGSVKASWDAISTSIDTTGLAEEKIKLKVDTSNGQNTGDAFVLIPYDGNCSGLELDLSNNSAIKMDVNATSKVEYFYIAFCDGSDNCADFAIYVDTLEVGDNSIDYAGVTAWKTWDNKVVDSTAVTYVLIGFRAGAYGTAPVPGTYTIDRIELGDAPVGLDNGVKGESISAYPNPATTKVSFEQELENVTIYNVVGLPVYEAQSATSVDVSTFDSGIYYIQHSLGTSRFTVQ